MDPITITLTLLALKTVLGGKTAVSADPKVANAQQQLAEASALNTKIQQEVVVLKQQADQAKREMESANDARTKAEAANRAVEAQKQRDEGLRVQAASSQDVADLKQQLAVAVGVAQSARNEKEQAQAALQKQLAASTALNTKIQQEVVVLQKQTEQAKQDLQTTVQRSGEERRNEKEAAFAEAQRQRDEGLRVQAESAKVVVGLQQQLAAATQAVQQSGEARRDEKEAAFQREMALKAQYAAYELGLAHKAEVERDLQNQYAQQRAAYERRIYELQAAAASKTAPVTITKSVTSRDLNRN